MHQRVMGSNRRCSLNTALVWSREGKASFDRRRIDSAAPLRRPSRCRGAAIPRRVPVCRQPGQPVAACLCEAGLNRPGSRAKSGRRTTRDRDQILPPRPESIRTDVWGLMRRRREERPRVQPHQGCGTAFARHKQHDPRRRLGERIARVSVSLSPKSTASSQPIIGLMP